MNYICSWLCADQKGEESLFPQTGQLSSSQSHQDIYWRCLLLFYMTSRRFNHQEKHLLFTNVRSLPQVDGRSVAELLAEMDVEVIVTDFKYKTPKGYFKSFQNQFYEFSILEYISTQATDATANDHYLILDSDCIFLRPVQDLFDAARPQGFIGFRDEAAEDLMINGLSRIDMQQLYGELLGRPVPEPPPYHLGEFFLASVSRIRQLFADFLELWPDMLRRYANGEQKFNEEAHTLSFLYYKNGLGPTVPNTFMKRIWTNPLFYRDAAPADVDLAIWHLPSEKTFGIRRMYDLLFSMPDRGASISDAGFRELVQRKTGIPYLPVSMRVQYYAVSYYRAIHKRLPWKKAARSTKKVTA